MARAKRTERADARRRYRAAMVEADPEGAAGDEEAPAEAPVRSSTGTPARSIAAPARAVARPAAAPVQRPSITGAFRSSFRPIDLRADLRALPRLLLTKAFLIPTVVSGASVIAFAASPSLLTATVLQYVSYPFPIVALFLTGFLAPRASYLLGIVVAIVATAFELPIIDATAPAGSLASAFVQSAIYTAVYGAFFAAAAAWYRRFLNRANPNRSRPAATASSRRPDGKIPRKPQQRPMLARRR